MKDIKTKVCALILAILTMCVLVSCQKEPAVNPPLQDAPEFTGFSVADLAKIDVIYPEYCSNEIYHAGKALCNAIETKTSIRPGIRDSYVDGTAPEYMETEYEILLGVCENREESDDAAKSVRQSDYGYKLVGKKIVFYGSTDESIIQAINTFIDKVVNVCDGETFYRYTMDYMFTSEYAMDSVTLNGTNIYEYGIVYPNKCTLFENRAAERLAEAIADRTGYILTVTSDKSVADDITKWISIGTTKVLDRDTAEDSLEEGVYNLSVDAKGNVILDSGSVSGYVGGSNALISMLTDGGKSVSANISEVIEGKHQLAQMSIMSFNILTTKPDEARINRVVQTILNASPDTVGLQEASPYWIDVLKDRLKDTYAYVGEGRDGGHNGEYSCVFYKKDKFELLDTHTYWLSETPDVVSWHPDSAYIRIMTYAKLRNKDSGQVFTHVNTHLDNESKEARIFQASVLMNFTQEFKDMPVFITGDFNCVSSEKTYKTVTDGGFYDAALIAPTSERQATFPESGKVIDFCFCNEFVYPLEYEVIDDKIDGQHPSDHCPILVRYEM